MKKRAQLLVTIILSLAFLPFTAVLAVDGDTTVSNTSTNEQPVNDMPTIQEDTAAADYNEKLQERLTKRKEVAKTKLSKAQETRLKARCKTAQGLIQSISANAKQASTSRTEIYTKVATRIINLSDSLEKQGVDTTDLDTKVAELEKQIAAFGTSMADLRQAAVDLSTMDCTTDPAGFKASLEALRTSREAVAKDSAAIRAYIKDTLKPALETVKVSLGGTSTSAQNQEAQR